MDFHSIVGKLRQIESLGTRDRFVAEEATDECNVTMEGDWCPVHGMAECSEYGLQEIEIDPVSLHVDENVAETITKETTTPVAGRQEDIRHIIDTVKHWNESMVSERTPQEIAGDWDNPQGSESPTITVPDPTQVAANQPAPAPAASKSPSAVSPTAPKTTQPKAAVAPQASNTQAQSFKQAFSAARKLAGGGKGVFTWQGKQYQTNVKGEPYLPVSKLTPVTVTEDVDPDVIQFPGDDTKYKKQPDGTYKIDVDSMDNEITFPGDNKKFKKQPDGTYKLDVDSLDPEITFPGNPTKYKRQPDGSYAPATTNEDAPLVGMPFTPIGATNNGPDTQGFVYAYSEGKGVRVAESMTINTTIDSRDGKITKTLNITATDEEAENLASMLRNAGVGLQVMSHPLEPTDGQDVADMEFTAETADHDYGHDDKSESGEPLDVNDYIWDGPHINQRFGKIGDNTLMYERAGELFKSLSEEYDSYLTEAELEPSNAGFDSPLTANSRDAFDKDPFVDETPVDDGSHSPLSTVKRQDVMN